MLLRNPGTNTRKHPAQHHHRCVTIRSDLYVQFRRTCLPNASHGPTSWTPLKQNISTARNYDEPSPLQHRMGKNIYILTNCSVRRRSAPVFGWRRGTEIFIKQSETNTCGNLSTHDIQTEVQSTSPYIGAPTLRPFPSEKCTNLFVSTLHVLFVHCNQCNFTSASSLQDTVIILCAQCLLSLPKSPRRVGDRLNGLR